MNQAAQNEKEDDMNDALVPGTFGGDKLPIAVSTSDIGANEDRVSNNSNSYYAKPTSNYNKEGPSMSITGSDGMLSFNPSGLAQVVKQTSNSSISGKNGEAPPMSFGGTTL
jgi:hypothetical protein